MPNRPIVQNRAVGGMFHERNSKAARRLDQINGHIHDLARAGLVGQMQDLTLGAAQAAFAKINRQTLFDILN